MPTRRLFLLFLLTVPLVALGGVGRQAAVALALLLLAAASVDWWLARDVRRVGVIRDVEDKLSLADWNPVALRLSNPTARAMRLIARDIVPPDFAVEGADVMSTGRRVLLPAGGDVGIEYRVRPRHRGNYAFGTVYLRAQGPLGLTWRQHAVPGSSLAVRVYPSLRQLRRYELLVRRGLTQEAGTKPVRAPGASTEFEGLREYVTDDEFRRINWKATARRGKAIVNQYEAERSQNVVIMIDAGRLMGARADLPATDEAAQLVEGEAPAGLTKLDYALNAALLLAYVASVRGDRIAFLSYADEVRTFVPPTRGRRAFLRMVDAFYALDAEPIEPDHGLAFQFLAGRNLRRSLVVLFTDLADRESSTQLVANVLRAARHHLVVCVTLSDPTVTRPAAWDLTTASGSDATGFGTDQPHGVAPGTALYEKMVAQRLLDERAAVLGSLTQRGVYSVDTEADKLSPGVIQAYLELKSRGRI
ncbi:MAG: hypothetical protein AVDCRST_MAG77-2941 [uncultured Chloroflexi bacterium]|uniref:DUF58 domain-containing protein n=1 Tax=uncultured Chloroflexota bacterium TaxID=166587 RepID=A0A6J4IDF2_9CHLR|nr:MAG: hypothetical protein AVDCRST_MAG77-2941 [uncultured Chloroflexota bacterium]